jgi:vacuolar protein sorting-associated protein 72
MEAALATLSIEDVKDEADDRDFIIVRGEYSLHIPHTLSLHIVADEEDVFESDFESTDEEAETAQQTADAGERQVRAEERKEKKVDLPKFFQLVDLPSHAGCAEPG